MGALLSCLGADDDDRVVDLLKELNTAAIASEKIAGQKKTAAEMSDDENDSDDETHINITEVRNPSAFSLSQSAQAHCSHHRCDHHLAGVLYGIAGERAVGVGGDRPPSDPRHRT